MNDHPFAERLLFVKWVDESHPGSTGDYYGAADAWVAECPDGTDPRSVDNPFVHTFDETQESDWGSRAREQWYIVGARGDWTWVGVDYDGDENHTVTVDFDKGDARFPTNGSVIATSKSGWPHSYCLFKDGAPAIQSAVAGVDLLSDDPDIGLRGAVSPWHDDRRDVLSEDEPVDKTRHLEKALGGESGMWGAETGDGYIEVVEQKASAGVAEIDVELPDDAPDELYECEQRLLETRSSDKRHEYGESPFQVDTHAAMIMLYNGRTVDEATAWFKRYPPAKAGGFDADETRKQLRLLESKISAGDLSPPAKKLGVEHENCSCAIHGDPETVPFVRYPAVRNLLMPVATEAPDTDEVRERLRRKILATARTASNYVIDAPTSSGKTHQFSTMEWVGEIGVPAVHFHGSRDARDEAMEMSEEADVAAAKLRGRKEACPVAGGEHDHELSVNGEPASEFIDRVCDKNGVPFSMVKGWLQQYNDQGRDTLPCREDGQCRAETQHNGIPFGEDDSPSVDVVHATHPFMHVPGYTTGTVVGIDEPPSFDLDIELFTAVNAYLRTTHGELESIADLIAAGDRELISAASRMNDPGDEWFMLRDAHTAAPAAAEALATALVGGPDDNGRVHISTEYKPPGSAVNQLSAVFDVHDREFRNVRSVPSLEYARAVVGLEENPSEHKWPRVTGLPNMQVDKVLGDKERRAWRRENRGLVVSQIGDSYRPLTKGTQYLDKDSLRLILGELQRVHGEDAKFGVITSKEAEGEVTRIASQELGSRPPTMHYGDTRSKNDFRDVDVMLAVGNIDPGDGYVLDMAAEYGLDAVPERDPSREHKACAGTGCRECRHTGNARRHGRGFDGEDSEKAEALLRDITHKEVAQALGRVARGDQGAFAYAWTNAVPERLVDHELPDPREITEKQRDVLEAVEGGATAPEAAREAGVSRQYARDILEEADEAARSKRAGPNGADYWRLAGGTLGSRDVWDPYTSQLPSDSAVSGQARLMAAREPGAGGHNADAGANDGPNSAGGGLNLEDFGLGWADDEGVEKIYTPPEYALVTGEDLRSLMD